MKLLSSFLVAAYANTTVDETQCHSIDGLNEKYRIFEDKIADVDGVHTALELIFVAAPDDRPNCLAECDNDEKCLFVQFNEQTTECHMAKVKADQSETIFNRPSMWSPTDDLVDEADIDIILKCQADSPCAVEYFNNQKWTEFHGKPATRVATPLTDGSTHADGTPATKADCPRICAENDDCTAFYHNPKTDECELFTNSAENWPFQGDIVFGQVDGGYTMAKCNGRCLNNWGKDTNDCFPELVDIECRPNGLYMNAHLSDIYENHLLLTDLQKTSEIHIGNGIVGDNDVVGGSFSNEEITIIKTWEELGVPPVYHAGDLNAQILPTIKYTATIKPMNPNIVITQNGPEIFLARTDNFDIKCIYPAEFEINTEYTTLTDDIGITGIATDDNIPMIGEFNLQSFSDADHIAEITPDAPIDLGEMIYNKLTVNDLPAGFDYIVRECEVRNIANQNWETDNEILELFEKQTCKNNDVKDVLGINIIGKNPITYEYSFDFVSFSFQSNVEEINSQNLVCQINICGTIGNDLIACETEPAQDTDCSTGFTL